MRTHVALLRGINVGGRNKVAMAELAGVVGSLGHTEVATYIQSGNVAFVAAGGPGAPEGELAGEIASAVASSLGVSCGVVVLASGAFRHVVEGNPFAAAAATEPSSVHALFLQGELDDDRLAAVAAAVARAAQRGGRDDARASGRAIYLRTADGFGRSALVAELARGGRAAPSAGATARNWATVLALSALLG